MSIAITPSITPDHHGMTRGWSCDGRLHLSKRRLLLLIDEDWYFRSHRLDLARTARNEGMEVIVTTRAQDDGKWIKDEGFKYLPIPFVRGDRRPLRELSAVRKLALLYRREQPDIVHHVAMKPILYGSLAARFSKIGAVVNAFGGLGCAFSRMDGLRAPLLQMGLRVGLRTALSVRNSRVIFQTTNDCERFIREKVVRRGQTTIIRGAGVDITEFIPQPETAGMPIIILACRMIWDKGVKEFLHAAKILQQQNVQARFVLVGRTDPDNPYGISEAQLLSWQQEGVVEWWGHRDDMPNVLATAHIVVLPTFYGEGIPKILLEAGACGRPVVTTVTPGCTDIVRDGENGFLIPQKDPAALAKAMKVLLENPSLRTRMGTRGRQIVVQEFSAQRMAGQTLAVYRELLQNQSST